VHQSEIGTHGQEDQGRGTPQPELDKFEPKI
jgi:hypothetical protein